MKNTPEPRNQWNGKALIRSYTSVSDMIALVLAGIPSLLDSLVGILMRRRVDALAVIVLLGIIVSLGASALSGSPQLLLVRESWLTTVFGMMLLVSLLWHRPAFYYVFRQLLAGNNQERIVWFTHLVQQKASFRAALYILTAIWGIGLVLEGLVRIFLAYTLPIAQFLAVSPTVSGLLFVLIFVCTGLYVRQWRNKHGSIIKGLRDTDSSDG